MRIHRLQRELSSAATVGLGAEWSESVQPVRMRPLGRMPGMTRRNATFLTFLLFSSSFLLGLYLVTVDVPPGGDGFEVMAVARNLARDGSFANPFIGGKTGPTAHTPPLYPAYLALLIRLGGDNLRFG